MGKEKKAKTTKEIKDVKQKQNSIVRLCDEGNDVYIFNNRVVKYYIDGFEGISMCHKDDKFDLDDGIKLAKKRALVEKFKMDIQTEKAITNICENRIARDQANLNRSKEQVDKLRAKIKTLKSEIYNIYGGGPVTK